MSLTYASFFFLLKLEKEMSGYARELNTEQDFFMTFGWWWKIQKKLFQDNQKNLNNKRNRIIRASDGLKDQIVCGSINGLFFNFVVNFNS